MGRYCRLVQTSLGEVLCIGDKQMDTYKPKKKH